MMNIFRSVGEGHPAPAGGKNDARAGEYLKRLERLGDAAREATSVPEVSRLVGETLCIVQQLVRAQAASLLLLEHKRGELYFHAAGGKAGARLNQMTISLDSGIARWRLGHEKPLIVNDVTGDEGFNNELDRITGFTTRSVMAVPVRRGERVIGILEAMNRVNGQGFTEPDLAALAGFAASQPLVLLVSMVATARSNIEQHQLLIDWYKGMVETLIAAVDTKDPYASGHSNRVKKYTMLAAGYLRLSLEELQAIEFGALLHDIGKLHVHDGVLRKSGPLTDKEWHIMRKHPLRGAHMLSGIPFLEEVRDIVLYHHERFDGKGYPQGLKGKDIPIGARLVAVAEAYDAMTTAHSYRDNLGVHDAMSQLIEGSGTQFCPEAVKAFVAALEASEGITAPEKAGKTAGAEGKGQPPGAAGDEAASAADPDIIQGEVPLQIASPYGLGQVKQFKKGLAKADSVKIVLEGWSEDDGTVIVVSVQKPLALAGVLEKMPAVKTVSRSHDGLLVTLHASAPGKAFKDGFSLVRNS